MFRFRRAALALALLLPLAAGCASRDQFLAPCGGDVSCADGMASAENDRTGKAAALVLLAPLLILAAIAEASAPPPPCAYGCVVVVPRRW